MQRRIKKIETDIEEFDSQVEKFVKNASASEFPNLQMLREIKARKILVNATLTSLGIVLFFSLKACNRQNGKLSRQFLTLGEVSTKK